MAEAVPVDEKLENARRELLDLTTRNRLLHTARTSSRSTRLEIVDELSDEIFRILVNDNKSMTFLPVPDDADTEQTELWLKQPEEQGFQESVAERHTDLKLQTALESDKLQNRLLKLYYDARTYQEEQGVNILFLALGFLKWYEDDKSDRERHAPLILIPVSLERRSAASKFALRFTDDEITTNLSLQEKLRADFAVELPDVTDAESLVPSQYFEQVQHAIRNQSRWEILSNDMVLWFFSFSKFLMYRDLQPETWPGHRGIHEHQLVQSLLYDGFRSEPPIFTETDKLDDKLQPLDMVHVLDADSSQTIVIEEAKQGQNLVVQGPPGTGKSQTIANLIATAVKSGKKVLFVAEKMAALEVVKRRLDNIGLGDMCLELHSNKANKRAVLEELARTLALGRPKHVEPERQAEQLVNHRDRLNRHAANLHTYLQPAHKTPYQVLGELVRLRAKGVAPTDFRLVDTLQWTPADVRERANALEDLAGHMQKIGDPQRHPWRGVMSEPLLPTDVDRIMALVPGVVARLERLSAAGSELGEILQQENIQTAADVASIARFGRRLVEAPPMDREQIKDGVWETRREQIDAIVATGMRLAACRDSLEGVVADVGWSADVVVARQQLAAHGGSLFRFLKGDYRRAQATLRGILVDPPPKPLRDRLRILDQLIEGQKILGDLSIGSAAQDLADPSW